MTEEQQVRELCGSIRLRPVLVWTWATTMVMILLLGGICTLTALID